MGFRNTVISKGRILRGLLTFLVMERRCWKWDGLKIALDSVSGILLRVLGGSAGYVNHRVSKVRAWSELESIAHAGLREA